jgi:high-affinity iron transporter
LGGFLAGFTGYRATPSGMTLLVLAGYWLAVGGWLRQRTAEKVPCLS